MKPMKLAAPTVTLIAIVFAPFARAQDSPKPSYTLISNVTVFDGTNEKTTKGSVLIENNLIKAVGPDVKAPSGAMLIDGGGKFLMPGMHDMHTHIAISRPPAGEMRINMDPFLVGVVAARRVEWFLMHGFTTIRDIGGPAAFMRRAVDAGVSPGPRILSAEAFITQTAGHGDFRNRSDTNPNILSQGSNNFVDRYYSIFADGPTEIRRGVRENMGNGANHIKIFTGGGISSEKDPLHAVQYTASEVRAAVEAADQYGTYVAAHAYTEKHIQIALDNGVKVIEHGAMLTPEIAAEMAKKGVWLVPSFKAFTGTDLESFAKMASPAQVAKAKSVGQGAEKAYRAAVNAKVKMAFGTDLLGPWRQAGKFERQVLEEFHWAKKFMSDFEVLRLATGMAGELHALCGENTPYKEGPTGVIRPGAYADLLIVDGNPLADVEILAKPEETLLLIMKDGKVYKNTLK